MADWSRVEVEATVADHFDMLEHEVHGQPYSKTAHRKDLAAVLSQRTDDAIERKHQVNDQYRITFRWEGHDAYDVCCEDYR